MKPARPILLTGLWLGLAALAGPAAGQTPSRDTEPARSLPLAGSDPIGDMLSGLASSQAMDDDASEAAVPNPVEPPPLTQSPTVTFVPPPPVARLPQLDRPVMIDELWRSPEAPPTSVEQAYESRIRGGLLSAQGQQGPLDGGWLLRGQDGQTLFGLQLVDRGAAALGLEGAWRELKPGQPAGRIGLIEAIARTEAGGLYLRFTPRGAREPVIVNLVPAGRDWSGELWESGTTRQVTLRRP